MRGTHVYNSQEFEGTPAHSEPLDYRRFQSAAQKDAATNPGGDESRQLTGRAEEERAAKGVARMNWWMLLACVWSLILLVVAVAFLAAAAEGAILARRAMRADLIDRMTRERLSLKWQPWTRLWVVTQVELPHTLSIGQRWESAVQDALTALEAERKSAG